MNDKVKELLEKAKASVGAVASETGRVAQNAVKKAGELVENTKLSIKVSEANSEIEDAYKEIGRLVYLTHSGEDVSSAAIEQLLEKIDRKNEEIKAYKDKIMATRSTVQCPNCGNECSRQSAFCSFCGNSLSYKSSVREDAEPLGTDEPHEEIFECDCDECGGCSSSEYTDGKEDSCKCECQNDSCSCSDDGCCCEKNNNEENEKDEKNN